MKILASLLILYSSFLIGEGISPENERIALVVEAMGDRQDHIWPSFKWNADPVIITFENGDIFALGLESADPVWKKVAISGVNILIAKEDKWGVSEVHMQSEFPIEGKLAFVYAMKLTKDKEMDVSILIHERFHRHQTENFEMKESAGISMDHLEEENLTWGEIEDQLIREFLAGEGEEKGEFLKDFVAVNAMRREAIDPETVKWENGQLKMEGLADYVATKALGGEVLLLNLHPDIDHENDFIDEAIKWRHYLAGASIGYMLDFIGIKGWREKVEAGEPLSDLLIQSMPLSKPERNKRIKKVQARLNYKKRRKAAEDKVNTYFARVDELEKTYEKRSGVKLFLGRPLVGISGGGANDEMVYLNQGTIVALNDSSIATTNDSKWAFETKKISHLFQHGNGVREVKVDEEAEVIIDQVSFKISKLLEVPREYPFKTLKFACETSALDSKDHVGVLVVEDGALFIHYF